MNTNWLTKIVLSDRTQHLSTKYSIPIEEIKDLLQYDPTKGKYLEWITKNYKSKELRFPEDGSKTIETLTTFTKLHPVLKRNNVPIDINLYSYSDLVRLIEQYGEQKSKREQYRINEVEGVKELLDFPPYKAIQILTPEASAKLCRGTEWCVKDPKFFKDYSDNLIMVLKNGEPYYLVHEESGQYKDTYDQALLDYKRNSEALDVLKILYSSGLVKGPAGDDFGQSLLKNLSINEITSSARLSYQHAKYIIGGRFEAGEAAIATSPKYSYYYAYDFNGRFELGEPAIAKNAKWSYWYADQILRGRFELGEPIIATHAGYSYEYARDVLKDRFELGEPTIAKDSKWAYAYANGVLKGRFELGEAAISKHPERSLDYARHITKTRFKLGEPTISTVAKFSYVYAKDVLKGRFELGEPAIATDAVLSFWYAKNVLYDRFELGEPSIFRGGYKNEYLNFLEIQ